MKLTKSDIIDLFATSSDIRLLTLKSPDYTRIGQVSDHIRKVSSTYFVVEEPNRANSGVHYHAILKLKHEPPKRWFKKGIHINLLKVGRSNAVVKPLPPLFPDSKKEILRDKNEGVLTETEELTRHIALLADKSRRTLKIYQNVKRVVTYLLKELTVPLGYANYILKIRDKGHIFTLKPKETIPMRERYSGGGFRPDKVKANLISPKGGGES